MDILAQLINFDTKSLIGVLVWGNIATGIIVYLYQAFNLYKTDHESIRNMTVIRFLFAAGYLLLFLRGSIHDIISVNIGNTLLFTSYYLESRLMLEVANAASKRLNIVTTVVLAVSVVVFNAVDFYYKDNSLRVTMASIIVFSIFLLPTIRLMTSKTISRFKRSVSLFYVLLLCALVPRSIMPVLDKSIYIHSNNYYQTLSFMSMILMMISNTIIYLLFMKEQTDIVLERMATIDHLTNVLNRHSFLIRGKQAFDQHKIARTGIGLLFFDIDHFKSVNDRYGHQFGDEVLIWFAATIQDNIRPNDLCCRYGGEEFIVLLMNVNEDISETIALRIMKEIEEHTFEAYPGFHLTTSVGSVSGVPKAGEWLDDYIRKGDEALYRAKKEGRNKLVNA